MGVCDYFVVKSDNHLTHNCQYTYVTHTVTNPSRICILVRPSTKIPEAQLIPHFPRAKHHIINLETDKGMRQVKNTVQQLNVHFKSRKHFPAKKSG